MASLCTLSPGGPLLRGRGLYSQSGRCYGNCIVYIITALGVGGGGVNWGDVTGHKGNRVSIVTTAA